MCLYIYIYRCLFLYGPLSAAAGLAAPSGTYEDTYGTYEDT